MDTENDRFIGYFPIKHGEFQYPGDRLPKWTMCICTTEKVENLLS